MSLVASLAISGVADVQGAEEGDLVDTVTPRILSEGSVLISVQDSPVQKSETDQTTSPAAPTTDEAVPSEPEEQLEPIPALPEQEPQLAKPPASIKAASPEKDPEKERKVSAAEQIQEKSNSSTETTPPVNDTAATSADSVARKSLLASFNGMQAGLSTKEQLLSAWGAPTRKTPTDAGQRLSYQLPGFAGVEVLLHQGMVTQMEVALLQPVSAATFAKKIGATVHEALEITDEQSGMLSALAYPEQGILLVFEPGETATPAPQRLITRMQLSPLEAKKFLLRAQQHPQSAPSAKIADLKQALALEPQNAEAEHLLAQTYLRVGKAKLAKGAARRALDIDEQNLSYQMTWADALAACGEYDQAVLQTRQVLDQPTSSLLLRAHALYSLGQLAARGDAQISEKTIGLYTMAIDLADRVGGGDDTALRSQATELLVDAHLAMAQEVALRDYSDKLSIVGQWVSRASALAEEAIASDVGHLELRLRVAVHSLAALSNFKPAKSAQPLIEEIQATLQQLQEESQDPLWQEQLAWSCGRGYLYAVQIEHHRREVEQSLEYGHQAIQYLTGVSSDRLDLSVDKQLVGQLYFYIGALHAVHHQQHSEAVIWYDKAFPLLHADMPPSELVVPRREGETLVSMAVSYWDQGEKQRALRLTKTGLELIQQGVEGQVIEELALAVPYRNLAIMYEKLGDRSQADRYAQLAKSVRTDEQASTSQATNSGDRQQALSKRVAIDSSDLPAQQTLQEKRASPATQSHSAAMLSREARAATGHSRRPTPMRTLQQ